MTNLNLLRDCIDNSYPRPNIDRYSDHWQKDWELGKVHTQNPLVYIKIQKNASTFFNEYLTADWRNINVKTENVDQYKNCDHFVVLRDPIERWITGMTTYLTLRKFSDGDNTNPVIFDGEFPEAFAAIRKSKWFKNVFQDFLIESTGVELHTCSQLWFISFFNLEKINFFYLNDKLGYQINHFLRIYNIENKCNNQKINQIPRTSGLYLFLNEMLRDAANVNFKNKLKDIYKYDYQFLENINFYAR